MSDFNAPTPVPTTILEDILLKTTPCGSEDSAIICIDCQEQLDTALTEIETYYTTRLKKCIGEEETLQKQSDYDKAHYGHPSADAQPNLQYVRQATRNGLRAEILSKWLEEA